MAHKSASRTRHLLIALVALGALAGGGYAYKVRLGVESTDDAFVEGTVVQISPRVSGHVTRLLVGDNQHVQAGELLLEIDSRDLQNALAGAKASLASAQARLKAAQADALATRRTAPSAFLQEKGALERVRAAADSARARIAWAESLRVQSAARILAAQAALEEARAGSDAAEALSQRAAADHKRYAALFDAGGASASQRDQFATAARATSAETRVAGLKIAAAQAAVTEAQAAQETAAQALLQAQADHLATLGTLNEQQGRLAGADIAEPRIARADAEAQRAEAEVLQWQSTVAQAQLDLSHARVLAPRSGAITRRLVEVGNFLRAGQPLMALVSDEKWVIANFKETQLTRMRPGQKVTFAIDAFPAARIRGHLESIQRGTGVRFSLLPAENATGNFVKVVQRVPVKLVFDEVLPESMPLALGMSVVPEIHLDSH